MPISADRFEEIDTDEGQPRPETNAARILEFLEEHANEAFTQAEIVEVTEVKRGSVGPTLVRLRERGRVDHRGQYWRISDHDRSIDAAMAHANEVAASHEETPFEYNDWQEYAVDPREEYVCTALTTSDLPENNEVGNAWITDRNPDTESYCSPWVIGTVKHRAVANPQGTSQRNSPTE